MPRSLKTCVQGFIIRPEPCTLLLQGPNPAEQGFPLPEGMARTQDTAGVSPYAKAEA